VARTGWVSLKVRSKQGAARLVPSLLKLDHFNQQKKGLAWARNFEMQISDYDPCGWWRTHSWWPDTRSNQAGYCSLVKEPMNYQALRKTEQGVAPNPSNGPIFLHGISHRFPMDFTSIPRGWPCLTGGTQKANHFLHRSQVPPAKLSCTGKHFNLPGLGVCPTSFKGKSQNICQNNHFIIHYPWRIHGAAIYMVTWIPSIYPRHVSIYTIGISWVIRVGSWRSR
jgi:hypothetical protein